MTILEELLYAAVDEHHAFLLYERLAGELEKRGLHRAAAQLMSMSGDEKRHGSTLQEIIQEVKVIGDLVRATAPESSIYWWVRLGDAAEYEKFNTVEEAKKYVEERTGKYFREAKWVNAYGFTLGPFVGRNYISFFEGDENAQPTERHTWGRFS